MMASPNRRFLSNDLVDSQVKMFVLTDDGYGEQYGESIRRAGVRVVERPDIKILRSESGREKTST
jgi:uroporphyrinogen-III synthase